MNELIAQLHALRKERALSEADVAAKCGLSKEQLTAYEQGAQEPSVVVSQLWAQALGCKLTLARVGDHPLVYVDRDGNVSVDGTPKKITPHQLKVLLYLARKQGQLVRHEDLSQHMYGKSYDPKSTRLRVSITKLRRILPVKIDARWRSGYAIHGIVVDPELQETTLVQAKASTPLI